MTNPAVAGVSEDITIEMLVTDGGVDYLVDTGTYTVCITNIELYYWDFTEIIVQGNNVYSQYNTSNFARMYLGRTAAFRQFGNYGSQGYYGEENGHSM